MNRKQLITKIEIKKIEITKIEGLKKKLLKANGDPRKDASADDLQELHNLEAKLGDFAALVQVLQETNKPAEPGAIENGANYKKPEEGQSDTDLPEGFDLGEGADIQIVPKTVDLVVLGKNVQVTRRGIQ